MPERIPGQQGSAAPKDDYDLKRGLLVSDVSPPMKVLIIIIELLDIKWPENIITD